MTSKETQSAGASQGISKVPLLDVGRGNRKIRDEILERIAEVYDAGCFVFGPDCKQLEADMAKVCDAEFGVGCASGSDALLLALMAYEIGPGDEVLVPSFTFFASVSAIWRLGAKPVFVDIDPLTYNIDPLHAASCVTQRTRAIIPVHLFGQCADMSKLVQLAEQHDLVIIEDAAQSIGARFDGQPCGSIGDVGCFSFYPTKNLGGCGDGGMLTTGDESTAAKLRKLANHGMEPRYYHSIVGINSRLDTFQAVALNAKLKRLDEYTHARQDNAAYYRELIEQADLCDQIVLPEIDSRCDHVWNQFTIRIPDGRRDLVRSELQQQGVGSEVYYPIPAHMQECFTDLGYQKGDLPHTEQAAQEVLSLPIFPELTRVEQQRVVDCLADALEGNAKLRKAS